tara:strand:+ start:2641 stop:3573 length:933 start_codon:yes stop_codon:yes gene_type:complete
MEKLRLYIYPNALPHAHDKEDIYRNTVPLSEDGIKKHCQIVSAQDAEYFYMGQISDGVDLPNLSDFEHFSGKENKHICDIEGDWLTKRLPTWLESSTLTMNGVRTEYVEKNIKIFTRPTFTYLLMDIIKNNRKIKHTFNDNKKFGFKGYHDPFGVRSKMADACRLANGSIDYDIEFNNSWAARSGPNSEITKDYCKKILRSTFSLCPRGTGVDTVRFFESCFFSRIPVVISNCRVFGHEYGIDNPFYFQIDSDLTADQITKKLCEIQEYPVDKLKNMSYNAKEYFENYVRKYFEDPTLTFINWLKEEKDI